MINKFRVAFKGLFYAFCDKSVKIQVVLGIIAIIAGFIFKLGFFEWLIIVICIGMVIGAEIVNTAIERLCDLIDEQHNPRIGYIKDISAGAVLLICIMSVVVALMIFIHKIGGF